MTGWGFLFKPVPMAIFDDSIDQMNDEIEQWDKGTIGDLRAKIRDLNIKHVKRSPNKIALSKALRSKLRQRAGITDRISYSMPRSAIFLHKGVSKGHPISNPRTAKPWYGPVVEKNLDKLADIVANGSGNLIINNINIK
jgi:hypothetical protein